LARKMEEGKNKVSKREHLDLRQRWFTVSKNF